MSCYGSIGRLGVSLIRRYFSPLKYKVELTSTTKLFELPKSESSDFYYFFCKNKRYVKKGHHRRTTEPTALKLGTRIPELLCYSFMKRNRTETLQSRAINNGSDLGRPSCELTDQVLECQIKLRIDKQWESKPFARIFGALRLV